MLDAHVVSHTHWDREWYQPLERFRQRLVALVDELIDEPPVAGESFLLDGQAIVLEDYLGVRPERETALAALLQDGRLEAGPWYVLGDELIPGGEAIVRNLLEGSRIVRRLGGAPPPVLYSPDSFGHPAALPAIAHGFGFSLVLLWRGYGSARWPSGDTVRWAAPDGSEVTVYHLARSGYEFGSSLPAEPRASVDRWAAMRAQLAGRATTSVVLIPNGADHHARQRHLAQAVAAMADAGGQTGDRVHASSLTAFATALLERAAGQHLALVRGELRDSYGYTWTLPGTLATRAHEKRLNAHAERLLVRDAEPWAALAYAAGGTSRAPLVRAAWRDVLQSHPHDTLCGCSIDSVARAMEHRLDAASVQGRGIRDDALHELLGHDPVAARDHRDAWTPTLVLRNPAARAREGVATVRIEEFLADVPVGPGSAPGETIKGTEPLIPIKGSVPVIGAMLTQPLRTMMANGRTESPLHYPDNDLVRVTEALVWSGQIQGYSTVTIPFGTRLGAGGTQFPKLPVPRVTARRTRVTNGILALDVGPDGAVTLTELSSGRTIAGLVELTDQADLGDLYTPSLRGDPVMGTVRSARVTGRGPLRGEIEVRYRVPSPVAGAEGKRRRRARRPRPLDVTVTLTLDAGAAHVGVRVTGENLHDNHRLRVGIRTDVQSSTSLADAAFGVVERHPIAIALADREMEAAPDTNPLQRYVSLFHGPIGATVYSDGLAEYENARDGRILITLLRAAGELSRNDLPERPGHAGWPTPTPLAQCHGPFEARCALMLHGPRDDATIDLIERTADDVLLPIQGFTLRSALAVAPPSPGLELHGPGLAFSACKEADAGGALVLRCVNLLDREQRGRWECGVELSHARVARLDEHPSEPLEVTGSAIDFVARPRETVTIVATPCRRATGQSRQPAGP